MEKEFIVNKNQLDEEWVDLILSAIDMGLSVQEIKEFLASDKMEVDFV